MVKRFFKFKNKQVAKKKSTIRPLFLEKYEAKFVDNTENLSYEERQKICIDFLMSTGAKIVIQGVPMSVSKNSENMGTRIICSGDDLMKSSVVSFMVNKKGKPIAKSFFIHSSTKIPAIEKGPEWSILPAGSRPQTEKTTPV